MSLLLLFVASESLFGWPSERGTTTITIAHITFSLAFVAVLVQARLSTFDRSLEEAALDLGAPPWKVYLVITLPLIAPALISGWLLAFTMSLDDLVISSFVSGPGIEHVADGGVFDGAARAVAGDQRTRDVVHRRHRHRHRRVGA